MYKIELKQTLCRIVEIFYFFGIWQTDEESTIRKAGKKFCYAFVLFLFPIFFATNAILCTDRNESIFSVQLTVLSTVLYVKFLYLVSKKKEILEFLNDKIVYQAMEECQEFGHYNKTIETFLKFIHFYVFMIIFSALLVIGIKLPMWSADKYLPLFITFSWNNSEIIYWLAFVFVSLSMVFFSVVNLLTVVIWYIMLNYSIEYQRLGIKFRNLGWDIKEVSKKKVTKKQLRLPSRNMFVENLIVLVKNHQNLTE